MDDIDKLIEKVERESRTDYEAMEYGGEHFEDVGRLAAVCRELKAGLSNIATGAYPGWEYDKARDTLHKATRLARGEEEKDG